VSAVDPAQGVFALDLPAPDAASSTVTGPAAPTTPSPKEAPTEARRDNEPVDIAVADMVVAALSIATNGADDVIVVRDPVSADEVP